MGGNSSNPRNGIVFRNESRHIKKSTTALLVDGKCFYILYPSRLNENQLPNRMGHFEDLTQYCGLCFNQSENVDLLVSTVDGQSLFDWSLYIRQLERENIIGCNTLREKQLVDIGYFF